MKQSLSVIACSLLLFANTGCYGVANCWSSFWGCHGCGHSRCGNQGCNTCGDTYAPNAAYYPGTQEGCGCEHQHGDGMMQPGPMMYAPPTPMAVPVGPAPGAPIGPVGPAPDPNLLPQGSNPKLNPVTHAQMHRGQIIYVQTTGHQQ